MTIEHFKKLVHDVVSSGKTPKTFLCTPDDAEKLGLPKWTRQFMGMKVVIGYNLIESKVVPHEYVSTTLKKNQDILDELERDAQRQMKAILAK